MEVPSGRAVLSVAIPRNQPCLVANMTAIRVIPDAATNAKPIEKIHHGAVKETPSDPLGIMMATTPPSVAISNKISRAPWIVLCSASEDFVSGMASEMRSVPTAAGSAIHPMNSANSPNAAGR